MRRTIKLVEADNGWIATYYDGEPLKERMLHFPDLAAVAFQFDPPTIEAIEPKPEAPDLPASTRAILERTQAQSDSVGEEVCE